jgi:hypothetical protein
VRSQRRLRVAVDGVSGAGKTYSALRLAFSLVQAGMAKRVAVIDTENSSASLYAGENPDGVVWDFDTLNLTKFGPDQYTNALNAAVKAGYDFVVVDGLSQAWVGEGGALDIVDQKGGKFQAWKDVTPMHRKMVDTIIHLPAHVAVTMRSKTEHVMEKDDRGNTTVRKIGLAPVQRDGMEYEFDLYGTFDLAHQIKVTKTRCSLMDKATAVNPGPEFWAPLIDWLRSAAPSPPPPPAEVVSPPPPPVAAPANTLVADLSTALDKCEDSAAARNVGKLIEAASKAGQISLAETKRLHDQYRQVKVRLEKEEAAKLVDSQFGSASPAADAPNNPPEGFRDNFLTGVAYATQVEQVAAILAELAEAEAKGWVTPAFAAEVRGAAATRRDGILIGVSSTPKSG